MYILDFIINVINNIYQVVTSWFKPNNNLEVMTGSLGITVVQVVETHKESDEPCLNLLERENIARIRLDRLERIVKQKNHPSKTKLINSYTNTEKKYEQVLKDWQS